MGKQENDDPTTTRSRVVNLSLRMSHYLHEKLDKTLNALKAKRNHRYSKQQWISEAIIEKLEREEEEARKIRDLREELSHAHKTKRLPLIIHPHLADRVNDHLDVMNIKGHYYTSKHSWIVHAIEEKLAQHPKH